MRRRDFIKIIGISAITLAAAADSLKLTGPSAVTVKQGERVLATLQLSHKGKPQVAQFSVSGLPAGLSASFSPMSCKGDCQTILTISAAPNAAVGSYSFIIRAETA